MIKINEKVLSNVFGTIGARKPEQGGIFGEKNNVIYQFQHDIKGSVNSGTYTPDTKYLMGIIRDWETRGVRFCGFIHSHPSTCPMLSSFDKEYALRIMTAMPETTKGRLEMPILIFKNGKPVINWYTMYGNGRMEVTDYQIFSRYDNSDSIGHLPPGWFH